MAKKPKVPPPPSRRRAGPKQRQTHSAPSRRTVALVCGGFAAALVVVVATVALVARQGADATSPEQALASAGCTLKTLPDQGQEHVDSYDANVSYNSNPPTSGPHYVRPAIWGAYGDPVPPVAEVHNLEHGGVVIHYGDQVDAQTQQQLRAFYDESPNGILMAPLPELGDTIALTAWTRLATCERFDEKGFSAFRSAFRGNGPERFRIGDLAPGT